MKKSYFKKYISYLFDITGEVILIILLVLISALLLLVYVVNWFIEWKGRENETENA